MATNVTQKDQALRQVIAYCEKKRDYEYDYIDKYFGLGDDYLAWDRSRLQTFKEVIAYCESMLGYSGSMPSEVPNQSEDAGTEVEHA